MTIYLTGCKFGDCMKGILESRTFILFKLVATHFTVMDGSEAEGDLSLIQTFLLYHVNQFILMLTNIFQEQFP